jgi:hypothetical protein
VFWRENLRGKDYEGNLMKDFAKSKLLVQ